MPKVVAPFTPQHPIAANMTDDGTLSMNLSKDDLKRAYAELAKANETSDAYSWVFAKRPRWKKGALVAGSMSDRCRIDVESMDAATTRRRIDADLRKVRRRLTKKGNP